MTNATLDFKSNGSCTRCKPAICPKEGRAATTAPVAAAAPAATAAFRAVDLRAVWAVALVARAGLFFWAKAALLAAVFWLLALPAGLELLLADLTLCFCFFLAALDVCAFAAEDVGAAWAAGIASATDSAASVSTLEKPLKATKRRWCMSAPSSNFRIQSLMPPAALTICSKCTTLVDNNLRNYRVPSTVYSVLHGPECIYLEAKPTKGSTTERKPGSYVNRVNSFLLQNTDQRLLLTPPTPASIALEKTMAALAIQALPFSCQLAA